MLKLILVFGLAALVWTMFVALDWVLGIGVFAAVFAVIAAAVGVVFGIVGAIFGVVAGVLGAVLGVLALVLLPIFILVGLVKLFKAAF